MTGTTDEKLHRLTERFEQHLYQFEQHKTDEGDKFDKLIEASKINTDSIYQLTLSVNTLTDDTREVIKLHRDFQGTIRLGKGLQSFMIWCLKWGMIGAGIVAVIKWLIKQFG